MAKIILNYKVYCWYHACLSFIKIDSIAFYPSRFLVDSCRSPFLYSFDSLIKIRMRLSRFQVCPETGLIFSDNGTDFRIIKIRAVIMNFQWTFWKIFRHVLYQIQNRLWATYTCKRSLRAGQTTVYTFNLKRCSVMSSLVEDIKYHTLSKDVWRVTIVFW